MKLNKIDTAKNNISKLVHTLPGSLNEKAVLKQLGMSALSRKVAVRVLLEILNVAVIIKKRKENKEYERRRNN